MKQNNNNKNTQHHWSIATLSTQMNLYNNERLS
jgi:hypothetical protein